MGRTTIHETCKDKISAMQEYQKEYYNKTKAKKVKISVIENAINRIMRDDAFIQMFLETVGYDKISELLPR